MRAAARGRAATLLRGAAALLVAAVAAYGCSALPPMGRRAASFALDGTHPTRFGQAIAPLAAAHPGRSCVFPLIEGRDAFAQRSAASTPSTRYGAAT